MFNIPQSTAYTAVFKAYLSSDHVTEATGKTIAITISKAGGAFGNPSAGATNATAISSGWYKVNLSTTDTNTLGAIAIRGAEGTIDDVGVLLNVIVVEPTAAAIATAVWEEDISLHNSVSNSGAQFLYNTYAQTEATSIAAAVWNADTTTYSSVASSMGEAMSQVPSGLYAILNVLNLLFIIGDATTIGSTGNDTTHLHLPFVDHGNDGVNEHLLVFSDVSAELKYGRWITDWDTSTNIATITPALPVTPENGTDIYMILSIRRDVTGGSGPSSADIADAVWDEVLSGHLTSGTTGAALNGAGSAGDPWTTVLPGAYGAGSAGKIVGDNLNATVSSRATQTSVDTIDDFVDTEVASILAAVDTEVAAIKTKTDFLPSATAGAAGGLFIAGTNAATTVTTSFTTTFTGNLTGSVGSVTGAVGSVTGNVGGNVTGSVGSIATGGITTASFAAGAINAAAIGADAITDAKVAADVTIASVTGSVGSVTGAVGSVTGNVGGSVASVTGAVGSVTGNVGGNVTGSVGSVATGGITAASIAADAIGASELAADAVAEIAAAISIPSAATVANAVWDVTLASHLTAGSTGFALNAAGSAGDPWSTALPGAYGAGTAGAIIGSTIPAINTKTASLTFTMAGMVDANIQRVNDVLVNGTGAAGNTWGP